MRHPPSGDIRTNFRTPPFRMRGALHMEKQSAIQSRGPIAQLISIRPSLPSV